jgi:hypothetical protein
MCVCKEAREREGEKKHPIIASSLSLFFFNEIDSSQSQLAKDQRFRRLPPLFPITVCTLSVFFLSSQISFCLKFNIKFHQQLSLCFLRTLKKFSYLYFYLKMISITIINSNYIRLLKTKKKSTINS